MRFFTKRSYVNHEIVVFHAWITYYPKFKNFDLELPGKAVVIHFPIPFLSKQYDIAWDEMRYGWRIPIWILSWYDNRIMLCYGNVMIKDMRCK